MVEWRKARKKPVVVEFREVEPKETLIAGFPIRECKGERFATREGVLSAYVGEDYIIRGVEGEIYPIKKAIFHKTYEVLE